jgi:hypothetical protein
MAVRKRYHILACSLVLMAVVVFLSATSRTKQDSVQELKKSGWGSAEEAFATASRTIDDYISTLDGTPVVIDPQFRATLHSRSKIWTVKGFAFSPAYDNQSYSWTVILDYDGVQDWEILVRIVTLVLDTSAQGPIDGVSQTQGKLVQENGGL